MKKILLTFDVEEADVLNEFGESVNKEEEFEISKQGLLSLLELLNTFNLKSTFFTTADFAKKYPTIIRDLSKEHEIACHGYCHSESCIENFSRIGPAKKEIEKIIKKPVNGFRAPRFEINDIPSLSNFGFSYDSSVYPTIAPGKYININQKRKIHKFGDITEIPLSTLPLFPFLRAPFNWYMFRHFPPTYGKFFTIMNFTFSDYLMLIFHPWEFVDLNEFNIPQAFKKGSGEQLLKKLERYFIFAKKRYEFNSVDNYLKTRE